MDRNDKGQFAPGQSGNPEGKKPGTKNRFTRIKEIILDAFEDRKDELTTLNINDVLKAVVALTPKEKSVEVTMNEPVTLRWQGEGEDIADDNDSVQTEVSPGQDSQGSGEPQV